MPRPPRTFNGKKYRQKTPPYRKKSDANARAKRERDRGNNARVVKAKPGAGKAKGAPWLYLVYTRSK